MKKSYLLVIIAVILLIIAIPSIANAGIYGDFEYEDNGDGTCAITRYNGQLNGSSSDVVIPDTIDGLTVIRIEILSFSMQEITSVSIPDSVTYIGHGAFHINELTYVDIPDSVTYIGKNAFSINKLTYVDIPDSVTYIGKNAFGDNELTYVDIPDSVVFIGDFAFQSNKLTSIELPSSVEYVGDECFTCNDEEFITFMLPNGSGEWNHNFLGEYIRNNGLIAT